MMRRLYWLLIAIFLSGCADLHYSQTKPGELKGKLLVQWIAADQFIFRPDENAPLTFTRYNNEQITPGLMYTDGGSIPRPLWGVRNFSPWGYAPAFIIHDWLFTMKHCRLPGYERYSLEEAAWVMSEVMKTMMEQEGVDKFTLYAMFEAVSSRVAAEVWDTDRCEQPALQLKSAAVPKMQYLIEFP
jgi:hypothetical protein